MESRLRHIALVVADIRAAEEYYRALFEMELLGREAKLDDGKWYTLPLDKTWEEAAAAGIELQMLALRKGDVVLALFSGEHPPGQVFAIGLWISQAEMAAIRDRIPPEAEVMIDTNERLTFTDRYGIAWQLVLPGDEFIMNGPASERWIEI